jgi:hypothetical protein
VLPFTQLRLPIPSAACYPVTPAYPYCCLLSSSACPYLVLPVIQLRLPLYLVLPVTQLRLPIPSAAFYPVEQFYLYQYIHIYCLFLFLLPFHVSVLQLRFAILSICFIVLPWKRWEVTNLNQTNS